MNAGNIRTDSKNVRTAYLRDSPNLGSVHDSCGCFTMVERVK